MNDVRLKKIIEECIGNNDPYWNNPVYEVVKKLLICQMEKKVL